MIRTTFLLLLLSVSSIGVAQENRSKPPQFNLNEVTVEDGGTVLQGGKPSEQSNLRLQVVFVPDGIEQRIQRSTELSDQEQADVLSFLTSAFRSNGSVSDKGTQQTHVAINRTVASAAIDRLIRVYRILSKDDVSCSATESFSEVTLRRGLDIGATDKTLWQVRELEKRDGTRGFQLKRQMEPDPGDTNQEPTSVAVTVRFSASETAVLPWYFHFLEEDIRKASRERWHGEHFLLIDTVNTESTPGESASKKDTTEATIADGGNFQLEVQPPAQVIKREAAEIAKALESATHIDLNAGSSPKSAFKQPDLNAVSRGRLGEIIAKLMKSGTIELGTKQRPGYRSQTILALNFTEQEYEDGGNLLPDVVAELRRQQDQQENKERQSQIQALLGTNESGQETNLVELPLRHAHPADVAKVLNELFPSITFSASTDSIFGRLSEADLTAVERIIGSLETKAMDSAQREADRKYKWSFAPDSTTDAASAIEVQLKHISASDAIDTLRQLGLITGAVASPNGNSLLFRVTETEEGQPSPIVAARQIIDQIDVPAKANDAPPASKSAPRGDKSASNLQSAYVQAELQSAHIAMEMRKLRATGRDPQTILFEWRKLRESVQIAFDLRMKLQQAQLAEAEADLKLARERLARRQQLADKIIDRRVQELQDGEDTTWQGNERVSQSSARDTNDKKSPIVVEFRGSSESLERCADSTDTIDARRPNAETKPLQDERNSGVATLRLGFNFSNTPWMDVLSYLADNLSLTLDVQERPSGDVSLLRSNLTAGEAIDELNRKLAAQSLTIQQTPTFLIVKALTPKPLADPEANPSTVNNRIVQVELSCNRGFTRTFIDQPIKQSEIVEQAPKPPKGIRYTTTFDIPSTTPFRFEMTDFRGAGTISPLTGVSARVSIDFVSRSSRSATALTFLNQHPLPIEIGESELAQIQEDRPITIVIGLNREDNTIEQYTSAGALGKAFDPLKETNEDGVLILAVVSLERLISLQSSFDLPTRHEILTALPQSELDLEGARIACELEAYKIDKPHFYPLVGVARLAHTEFKCTVHSDKGKETVTLRRDRLIRSEH